MLAQDAPRRAPTFRPLRRSDYPLLRSWLAEPHVARWWSHEVSEAAVDRDFGPSIDGSDPAEIFVVQVGGSDVGLLQRYRFSDNPAGIDELAPLLDVPGAALGIDYFVGEPSLLRRGVGTAMIAAAVEAIWRDHPQAPSIVVPVNASNVASWRALERCGFERVACGPLPPYDPIDNPAHFVYRAERLPPGRRPRSQRPSAGPGA